MFVKVLDPARLPANPSDLAHVVQARVLRTMFRQRQQEQRRRGREERGSGKRSLLPHRRHREWWLIEVGLFGNRTVKAPIATNQ